MPPKKRFPKKLLIPVSTQLYDRVIKLAGDSNITDIARPMLDLLLIDGIEKIGFDDLERVIKSELEKQ